MEFRIAELTERCRELERANKEAKAKWLEEKRVLLSEQAQLIAEARKAQQDDVGHWGEGLS